MKNKPLGSPVIDVTVAHPSWYQPGFERPDKRVFERGEMVKFEGMYCYVLEDNRAHNHCTYTYCLIPCDAKEEVDQSGHWCTTVYGAYPKNIEPCNSTEFVLYHNKELFKHYFEKFTVKVEQAINNIEVTVTIKV
jgi:hypothetical protein